MTPATAFHATDDHGMASVADDDITNAPDNLGGGGGAQLHDLSLKIIYAFICFLGVVGNGIVCIVFIAKRREFRSITNHLILNQSLIDLLDAILFILIHYAVPSISESGTIKNRGLAEFFCRMWDSEYPLWSLYIASTVNLVVLSLERYFATCHPVRYRNSFSVKRTKYCMVCVWVYGALYQLYWPLVFVYSSDQKCYPNWPNKTVQSFMGILLFLFEYLFPISIMSFAYISIIVMLRNRTKRHGRVKVNAFQRAKRNVTTTLCIVFISYIVCWTPTELTYLAYNLGHDYDFKSTTHDVVKGMVLLNMCINPVIYAFKYEHFQSEFKKMCCSLCTAGSRISSNYNSSVFRKPMHSINDNARTKIQDTICPTNTNCTTENVRT